MNDTESRIRDLRQALDAVEAGRRVSIILVYRDEPQYGGRDRATVEIPCAPRSSLSEGVRLELANQLGEGRSALAAEYRRRAAALEEKR